MAQEFVGFVPGLLGVEDFVEHDRTPDKVTMLKNAHANPKFMPYQYRHNRAPTYNEMCLDVALNIIAQQKRTRTNGKIIASSVGAAVLRGALHHLASAGHPMPDVILIGPVWDIAATVDKRAGKNNVASLLSGKIPALPMEVSGKGAGTFMLTRAFYEQARAATRRPLPPLPSLTILTSKDDVFCDEANARAIAAGVQTTYSSPVIHLWDGGHNDTGLERDNDVLLALSRTLRRPKLGDMAANVWDRFDGTSLAHWRKRDSLKALLAPFNNGTLSPEEERLTRAKLNIMRRIRVAPANI